MRKRDSQPAGRGGHKPLLVRMSPPHWAITRSTHNFSDAAPAHCGHSRLSYQAFVLLAQTRRRRGASPGPSRDLLHLQQQSVFARWLSGDCAVCVAHRRRRSSSWRARDLQLALVFERSSWELPRKFDYFAAEGQKVRTGQGSAEGSGSPDTVPRAHRAHCGGPRRHHGCTRNRRGLARPRVVDAGSRFHAHPSRLGPEVSLVRHVGRGPWRDTAPGF
jgi:hypothetical protein